MIRYFILEDVPVEIETLRENLTLFPELEYIGHSSEINHAVGQVLKEDPDLLFVDFGLIGGSALDILEQLEKLNIPLPYCVGTSGFDPKKGFDVERYTRFQHLFLDNLKKPFFAPEHFENRIRAIISKVRERVELPAKRYTHHPTVGYFFVQKFSGRNEIVPVEMDKIAWLEYKERVVSIHLTNGTEIKTEVSLSLLLSLLDCPEIKQVSRNHAVNIRFMEKYEDGYVYVSGNPISVGNYKGRFESFLKVLN